MKVAAVTTGLVALLLLVLAITGMVQHWQGWLVTVLLVSTLAACISGLILCYLGTKKENLESDNQRKKERSLIIARFAESNPEDFEAMHKELSIEFWTPELCEKIVEHQKSRTE